MISLKRTITSALAVLLGLAFLSLTAPDSAWAGGKTVLRGKVDQAGYNVPSDDGLAGVGGPSLSRKDIEKSPFDHQSAPANGALDAPKEAFQGASLKPKPSFGLHAEDEGGGNFRGKGIPGIPDQTALLPQEAAPRTFIPIDEDPSLQAAIPQNAAAADPDSSPEMQLAWDEWHHRVAEAIFERFKFFANKAFTANPMLVARVSYVVTREGRIGNVQFSQKCPNLMFNALILQCIKSINGDQALLQFPQGSRRMTVDKFGVFDMAGRGAFRYTVGDREILPGR
jgi:hypothetical protein